MVLGNGSIVEANSQTNSDLFQALKGGSNNFGIVTRFDFFTFEQGDLWGGLVIYPNSTTFLQTSAFVNFTNHIVDDPYASVVSFWQYASNRGSNVVINVYDYTKPIVNVPPFQEYLQIPGSFVNTMRITNLSSLTAELNNPYGYR